MEIPRHSLCVRYAEQLVSPDALFSPLKDKTVPTEVMTILKKTALDIGLVPIELKKVGCVETKLGAMSLLLEEKQIQLGDSLLEIPDNRRYILGYINISPSKRIILEKLDLIREPSQEDERYIKIEEITHCDTDLSLGRELNLTHSGRVKSIGFRRYFGSRFEFIKLTAPQEKINISIDKLFTRKATSPYEFKRNRSLQVNFFPEKDEFSLDVNRGVGLVKSCNSEELQNVSHTTSFEVSHKKSLFYTPNDFKNTVTISGGGVTIEGKTAYWKTHLVFDNFNYRTMDWESSGVNVESVKLNAKKAIELFEENMSFMKLEDNNVVLG